MGLEAQEIESDVAINKQPPEAENLLRRTAASSQGGITPLTRQTLAIRAVASMIKTLRRFAWASNFFSMSLARHEAPRAKFRREFHSNHPHALVHY